MAYDDIAGRPTPSPQLPRPRRRRPATSDRHAQHMHAPAQRPARLGVTSSGLASAPGLGDRPSYRMTKRRRGGRGAVVPEGMATTPDDAMWREQILALRQALMALTPVAPTPPQLAFDQPQGRPDGGRYPRMASEKFGVLDDSDVTTPHAFIRQYLR